MVLATMLTCSRVTRLACAMLAVIVVGLWAGVALAADEIGQVSRIQATAQAITDGDVRNLSLNAPIHLDDIVTTGDGARLEITLTDGTRIAVGARARVVIDDFVYQPANARARLVANIAGAFRFVTGGAGRIVGNQIAVETPFAIIGVRGTDFWAGPVDDISGVLLFEGAVSVSASQTEVTLDRPGQGTNIAAPGEPPGTVTIWPQDKVGRALDQVAFQ